MTLGDALNVHLLADHEMIGPHGVAHFQHVFFVDAEFGHLLARLDFGFGELAAFCLVGVLGLAKPEPSWTAV